MEFKNHPSRWFTHLMVAPIIYSMLIPIAILDIWIEIYHRICFIAYGLQYIHRTEYIRIDRQKLQYLTWFEKLNCMYCGYANGLLNYARVIAGETERYWCGIKHKGGNGFHEPQHHQQFIEYGDKAAYKKYSRNINK